MLKKLNYDEVYNRFKEKGLLLLDKEYISSATKMNCVDSYGYKYKIGNGSLMDGSYPEPFNKFNPYTLENVQHFLNKESNGSKLVTTKYEGSRMDLCITCEKCGKPFNRKWASVMQDKSFICDDCKENPQKYTLEQIKYLFKQQKLKVIDDKYYGNNIPLNCIDELGYKVKISYANLLFHKKPNRFSLKHNEDNYLYNINNYFNLNNINCTALRYSEKELIGNCFVSYCKCECGKIFKTTWSAIKNNQYRCKKCSSSMSKGEYRVKKFFEENNILYVSQKKFKDCKVIRKLPFDFYLPQYNCCIEVDGQQHYFPNKFSKEENEFESFEKRKRYDKIKDEYCKNNNIDLLRINYNDLRRKNNNYIDILSNKFIKK